MSLYNYKILKNTKEPKDIIIIGTLQNDEVIDEVNTLKNEILEEEKNNIFKEGYEKGFLDGKKESEEEIKIKIENIIKEIKEKERINRKNIIKKLIDQFKKTKIDLKEKIYDVLICILNEKENLNVYFKRNIKEMIEKIDYNEIFYVYFSKEDFEILKEDKDLLEYLKENYKNIKIDFKEELEKGDIEVKQENKIISKRNKLNIEIAEKLITENKKISPKDFILEKGIVCKIAGNVLEVEGLTCSVGDLCEIISDNGNKIKAEVIGYKEQKNVLMAFGDLAGIGPKSTVINLNKKFSVKVSDELIGRVLDGNGNFIDGKSNLKNFEEREINNKIPDPFERKSIKEKLLTGIRAIDLFLTCGKGQRIGIFAGSGVGKSSLLGMIARNTEADINVIALIGERGREVKDFIEKDLKENGLKKSIIVASTSDKSALERVNGALIAMTIAEYFKDKGKNVLFMMDSATRFAMALREIGLALGEVPSTKGYTPSVFSKLSKFIERSGNFINGGTITAFLTVLVEGDDFNEPIADSMRSFLDGHIVLSRRLAEKGHYPSIEINKSISRIMNDIVSEEQLKYANLTKEVITTINELEDLINIGAYKKGTNKKVDYSLFVYDKLMNFLKQDLDEKTNFLNDLKNLEIILKGKENE